MAFLRPEPLSADAKLIEHQEWVRSWDSYYDTMRMVRESICTQQLVFMKCLDTHLGSYLTPHLTRKMPVVRQPHAIGDPEPDSLMKTVAEIIKEANPLSTRRLQCFAAKPPPGMDMADWASIYEN